MTDSADRREGLASHPFTTLRESGDGLPWLLNFSLTARCNIYCEMCQSKAAREKEAAPERVTAFFERLAKWLPLPRPVLLTGGEPLLHPHVTGYVASLSRLGFLPLVNTNGALLNLDMLYSLIDAGLAQINFSLDGAGELHDRLRNAPGLFGGVMDMIKHISAATSLEITVVSVIHAENAGGLCALVRLLGENPRVRSIHFQAIVHPFAVPWSPEFYRTHPLWPTTEEKLSGLLRALDDLESLRDAGAPINNPASQFALWRRYFRNPGDFLAGEVCRVSERSFSMSPSGEIYFCDRLGMIGTIDDDPRELWESEKARVMRERMTACLHPCNYLVNCCYTVD